MSKTTGFTIWLTGMPRSGKSTIAELLAAKLSAMGRQVELLDDAEYSSIMAGEIEVEEPEKETAITRKDIQKQCNVQAQLTRRIGQAAMTLTRHDVIAVVAALSPIKEARDENRVKIGRYVEVYVDAPYEVLMKRENDYEVEYARITKTGLEEGRMQKALSNKAVMFGINATFDTPEHHEIEINTNASTPDECCVAILKNLCEIGYFTPSELEAMTGMKAKKYVRPSDEPMVPPKPRGSILLLPKNSPIRAELMKSPGKLPNDLKRALRENAQKIKAEQLALRQARMDALGPSKEALEAEKREAEAKKAAEAAKKKKEAEAKKAAEAAKKKKEAEKKKAAEAKKREAEAKKKAAEAAKKKKEAEKKKKEAEKKKAEAAKKAAEAAKKKKDAKKKKATEAKKKKGAVAAKSTAKVATTKAKAGAKAAKPSKSAASSKVKAQTASAKAGAKKAAKTPGKATSKAVSKAVSKGTSKTAAKASSKVAPKNAGKTATKTTAKPAGKVSGKAASKSVAKSAQKASAKLAGKSAAKAGAKKAEPTKAMKTSKTTKSAPASATKAGGKKAKDVAKAPVKKGATKKKGGK